MNENTNINFKDLEGKYYKMDMTEDFKETVFKNISRNETQIAPANWFKTDYPFVVDWFRKTDNWEVQVVFSLAANEGNNHYFIFIYDWRNRILCQACLPSYTQYPPVWNRQFGGIDYIDYYFFQKYIAGILESLGYKDFFVDDSKKDKYLYYAKGTKEEIEKLIQEGLGYQVFATKAEAVKEFSINSL